MCSTAPRIGANLAEARARKRVLRARRSSGGHNLGFRPAPRISLSRNPLAEHAPPSYIAHSTSRKICRAARSIIGTTEARAGTPKDCPDAAAPALPGALHSLCTGDAGARDCAICPLHQAAAAPQATGRRERPASGHLHTRTRRAEAAGRCASPSRPRQANFS